MKTIKDLWRDPWGRLFVVAWALLLLVGSFLPDETWRPVHDWRYIHGPFVNWWYFVVPPAVALAIRVVVRGFSSTVVAGQPPLQPGALPEPPAPAMPARSPRGVNTSKSATKVSAMATGSLQNSENDERACDSSRAAGDDVQPAATRFAEAGSQEDRRRTKLALWVAAAVFSTVLAFLGGMKIGEEDFQKQMTIRRYEPDSLSYRFGSTGYRFGWRDGFERGYEVAVQVAKQWAKEGKKNGPPDEVDFLDRESSPDYAVAMMAHEQTPNPAVKLHLKGTRFIDSLPKESDSAPTSAAR